MPIVDAADEYEAALKERIAELEAQAAAMRRPLAALVETRKLAEQGDWKMSQLLSEVWRRAGGLEEALSVEAGRALLAELEAARAVVAAARFPRNSYEDLREWLARVGKAVEAYDAAVARKGGGT